MLKNIKVIVTVFMLAVCMAGCSETVAVYPAPPEKSTSDELSSAEEASAEVTENGSSANENGSGSAQEKNDAVNEEISYITGDNGEKIPYATEYSDPGTFQYTEQMIIDMNEDNEDFEVSRGERDGQIYIYGLINSSTVSSERDVLEELMLVRSLIGMTDTRTQLYCNKKRSHDGYYAFGQCYAGIKMYSSGVYVWLDEENRISSVDVNVISDTDILKKINVDKLLDPPDKDSRLVLWDVNEYNSAPVPAYITNSFDDTTVTDAHTGKEIDRWSNIMD